MKRRSRVFLVLLASCAAACSNDPKRGGSGNLTVLLQAEDSITDGLDPGDTPESIVDGWTVRFDKYVVAIGDVSLGSDKQHVEQRSTRRLAVDLTQTAQSDLVFSRFDDIEAGQYDFFGFSLFAASEAERDTTVSAADFDEMVAARASYLVEGTLEKEGGQSCPPKGPCRDAPKLTFRFLVPAHVRFGPCQLQDVPQPGVAVTRDGTSSVGITIHGDHMFFDAFPLGAEIVQRRAQWLADSDLNGDGHVDYAELGQVKGVALSAVFPSAQYSLFWSGPPIETAADFLRGQLSTQGHYQGEGECEWEILP